MLQIPLSEVGASEVGGITHCCGKPALRSGHSGCEVMFWITTGFFQSFGPAGIKNKSSGCLGCSDSSAFLKGCVATACQKGTLRRALSCAQIPDAHPSHHFMLSRTFHWLCSGQIPEAPVPDINVSPCKTRKRAQRSRSFSSRALLPSYNTGQKSHGASLRDH